MPEVAPAARAQAMMAALKQPLSRALLLEQPGNGYRPREHGERARPGPGDRRHLAESASAPPISRTCPVKLLSKLDARLDLA